MLQVVLPAGIDDRVGERRRFEARLPEDAAQPHDASAREVRGAGPDRPRRRSDRERELLRREGAQRCDEALVREIPSTVERRDGWHRRHMSSVLGFISVCDAPYRAWTASDCPGMQEL